MLCWVVNPFTSLLVRIRESMPSAEINWWIRNIPCYVELFLNSSYLVCFECCVNRNNTGNLDFLTTWIVIPISLECNAVKCMLTILQNDSWDGELLFSSFSLLVSKCRSGDWNIFWTDNNSLMMIVFIIHLWLGALRWRIHKRNTNMVH